MIKLTNLETVLQLESFMTKQLSSEFISLERSPRLAVG